MKKLLLLAAASSCVLLSGCASIVDGTHQTISVSTPPVRGAHCLLTNSKGKWYIPNTPGSVTVHRDYGNLEVTCKKYAYKNAQKSVKSHTKGMAFGNVIFGGIIGAGVDVADGAAYHYPQSVTLPMKKEVVKTKQSVQKRVVKTKQPTTHKKEAKAS